MLTSDLIQVKVVGQNLEPRWLNRNSPSHLEKAQTLLRLLHQHQGCRFGVLGAAIQDIASMEVNHKIWKGLAKVLIDLCTFDAPILPNNPALASGSLRVRVFELAAQQGFATLSPEFGRKSKEMIVASLAEELGEPVDSVLSFLYADHKDMHLLTSVPDITTPVQLLDRYNLVLCQSILLHAKSIKVVLKAPNAQWLRLVFRRIKFYRLMYRVWEREDCLEILIDGPQSLLKNSSRYGLQFAMFLPVLPHYPGEWSVEADLLWGKKRKFKKRLLLTQQSGLSSHYKLRGLWRSNTEEWFEKRFAEKDRGWIISDPEVLDLGEQQVLIPNFKLTKVQDDATFAFLNIVGFWRRKHLVETIRNSPKNVIFAVSRKCAGDAAKLPKNVQKRVILYSEVIPVGDVISILESNNLF